jgi:hypothetical protein
VISKGRKYIDDYRIVDVLHEGYSSFLCRAIRERTQELVMIRLFTPESGVNEEVAWRLKRIPNSIPLTNCWQQLSSC